MAENAHSLPQKSARELLHYSEDPGIRLFRPHVAKTGSTTEPLVWALDAEHAPSYWFPRDCPRVCCWVRNDQVDKSGLLALGGTRRMHAIEAAWLERMRACKLHVYRFDPAPFEPNIADVGYWVAREDVTPLSVEPVGDLFDRHAEQGIELRIVTNLWPLIDAVMESGLEYSIIRKLNAQPR